MAVLGSYWLMYWGETGCWRYPATRPTRGILPLGFLGRDPPPPCLKWACWRFIFQEWVGVEPTLPGLNFWRCGGGEQILRPFWLDEGDFELLRLCCLSKLDDLISAEVPRRILAIWPRWSPELRPGRKTGGCSRSVPSSSREPTKMTVSHDCSEDEGSVNSDELEANLTNLQKSRTCFWYLHWTGNAVLWQFTSVIG